MLSFAKNWWKNTALEKIERITGVPLLSIFDLNLWIVFNNMYCDMTAGKWLVEKYNPDNVVYEDIRHNDVSTIDLGSEEYFVSAGAVMEAKERNISVTGIQHSKKETNNKKTSNTIKNNFLFVTHDILWKIYGLFCKNSEIAVHTSLYGFFDLLSLFQKNMSISLFGTGFRRPTIRMLFNRQPFYPIRDGSISWKHKKEINKISSEINKMLFEINLKEELKENLVLKGINLFEAFEQRLLYILNRGVYGALNKVLISKQLIEKRKSKLWILNNSATQFERAFCLIAKGLTKTLVMQHGTLHSDLNLEFPIMSDYLITYGEYDRRVLASKSPSDTNKIFPLGTFRYDKIFMLPSSSECYNAVKYEMKLIDKKRIILFVTQPYSDRYRLCGITYMRHEELEIRESVCRLIKDFPDHYLFVKIREKEESKDWEKTAEKHDVLEQIKIIQNCRLYHVIKASELVITGWSTIGFEAILCDVPLIAFNLNNRAEHRDYSEKGAALKASSFNELVENARKIIKKDKKVVELLSEKRKKYLEDHYAGPHASDKILSLFKKIVTE
jgi:hypothetical protein